MKKTLVMKFGGAAVASAEQFAAIANLIVQRSKTYDRVAVVVSAMGDTTDQLLALAKRVHPEPPSREQDMLVTAGERISIALLAMALHRVGREAVSFTGSQSGIITSAEHTDARIIEVRPGRLEKSLDAGQVVIVAGFQGVSRDGEITSLGRGGSDTSAVALGVALGAERVEFYKDVAGIYDRDPKADPDAIIYGSLTFAQALEIAQKGAQVLHGRCISLAAKNGILLHVLSFLSPEGGTLIGFSQLLKRPIYET